MYEFWYDYVKLKYGKNVKLSYMDTDSFVVHVKTECIYKDFAEDVETRFDTLNIETGRSLPKGKKRKVIGLRKDELSGQIMKRYSYLKDNSDKDKKVKSQKKCLKKEKLNFRITKTV